MPTPEKHIANDTKNGACFLSRFVLALLCFALLNVVFAFNQYSIFGDFFELQNKDVDWYTVDSFRKLKERPELIFFGSSLMCRIINEGEATYLKRTLNGLSHLRCQQMEDLLQKMTHTHITTASLSMPGLNASDASVLFSELVKNDRVPDVIVYGVAPRDFMDNSLLLPASTSPYRLMEKIGNLADVSYESRLTREDRFKYAVNSWLFKVCPIYKAQDELAVYVRRNEKRVVDKFIPAPEVCSCPAFDSITKKQLGIGSSEFTGYLGVLPYGTGQADTADYKNNYLCSYNPFKPSLYKPQMKFFDRFLKIAQERDIKVVLVNMPLRQDSFALMPPSLYDLYLSDLKREAKENRADFIDMQNGFADADFDDQVHLNGEGACKFVQQLTPKIADLVQETIAARKANRKLSLSLRRRCLHQKAIRALQAVF